jgi:hypothetical protein
MKGLQGKGPGVLLILVIMGAVLGSVIGKVLGGIVPIFNISESFGIRPTTIDLGVLNFSFGLILNLNLAGILGFLIAYLLYKKL